MRASLNTVRIGNSSERVREQTRTCEEFWHSVRTKEWPKSRCKGDHITPHKRERGRISTASSLLAASQQSQQRNDQSEEEEELLSSNENYQDH